MIAVKTMIRISVVCFNLFVSIVSYEFCRNQTVLDPVELQRVDFLFRHSEPIGIVTTSAGAPVDVRDTLTINTDALRNTFHLDTLTHLNNERIPERNVHAKGTGAFGYFEITNDVSKYTKADVFNGVGKKTPVFVRLSTGIQNLGGNDLARELKGFAVKFYTKEGNLDLLCLNIPVFLHKDPSVFVTSNHAFKRNPTTNFFDNGLDLITLKPETLNTFLWLMSEFGIPDNYRKMDAFAIHTYEIVNKHVQSYFVRFNFRTEQGIENLSSDEARRIAGMDLDYYNRDLYNSIELGDYPSWKLEMDILRKEQLDKLDYNPFDLTRLWRNGTYKTIEIGRLVLNENPDNVFRDVEQSAMHAGNLVPGIPGPVDVTFKVRKLAYLDTQIHRLGANHNNIEVNKPKYRKTYNRDGKAPVRENMKDAPNYYPNSYNGIVTVVEENRPVENLIVLDSNAIDLQPASDFYNKILKSNEQRQIVVDNIVAALLVTPPPAAERLIKLFTLVSRDLGLKVTEDLEQERRLRRSSSIEDKVVKLKKRYFELLSKKKR